MALSIDVTGKSRTAFYVFAGATGIDFAVAQTFARPGANFRVVNSSPPQTPRDRIGFAAFPPHSIFSLG